MTKTHEQWSRAAPRICSCAKLVLADWTEEREQQYQAGYKQGKVHTIAKWREDREQLQTEIELYNRHRVKLRADKASLVEALNLLLFLHQCEQEAVGRPPTPEEWMTAVDKGNAVIEEIKP